MFLLTSVEGTCNGRYQLLPHLVKSQPQSQALHSPERKTLVGSVHVATIFWVVTNKINVADVLKIDSCSYLA